MAGFLFRAGASVLRPLYRAFRPREHPASRVVRELEQFGQATIRHPPDAGVQTDVRLKKEGAWSNGVVASASFFNNGRPKGRAVGALPETVLVFFPRPNDARVFGDAAVESIARSNAVSPAAPPGSRSKAGLIDGGPAGVLPGSVGVIRYADDAGSKLRRLDMVQAAYRVGAHKKTPPGFLSPAFARQFESWRVEALRHVLSDARNRGLSQVAFDHFFWGRVPKGREHAPAVKDFVRAAETLGLSWQVSSISQMGARHDPETVGERAIVTLEPEARRK